MNTYKKSYPILFVFLLLLSVSCSDNNEEPEKPTVLDLDRQELNFNVLGGEEVIQLTANKAWEIKDVPDWVTVNPSSGTGSSEITVTVKKDDIAIGQEAEILFLSDEDDTRLSITQEKLKHYRFPFTYALYDNYTFGSNQIERIYNFNDQVEKLFINPSNNPQLMDKIFLGNLVSSNLKDLTDIETFTGYEFNQTDISTSVPIYSQEYIPSKEAQDSYVAEILKYLKKNNTINSGLKLNNGRLAYHSYRELNYIGKANMGIDLDMLISGKSYREQEMKKKNGLIFSFSHPLFDLYLEIPYNGQYVTEQLKEEDFPEGILSVIHTVTYGRIGALLIETDDDIKEIREIIDSLEKNKALSEESKNILNNLEAYHLYFDKEYQLKVIEGKEEALLSYLDQINQITDNQDAVYPYQISICDYFTSAMKTFSYNIHLP